MTKDTEKTQWKVIAVFFTDFISLLKMFLLDHIKHSKTITKKLLLSYMKFKTPFMMVIYIHSISYTKYYRLHTSNKKKLFRPNINSS